MSDERLAALEGRLAHAEARIAALEAKAPKDAPMQDREDLPESVQMALLSASAGMSPDAARQMQRAVRLKYAMTPGSPEAKASTAMQYISRGDADAVRSLIDLS